MSVVAPPTPSSEVARLQAKIADLRASLLEHESALLQAREETRAAERRAKALQARCVDDESREKAREAQLDTLSRELESERLRARTLEQDVRLWRDRAQAQRRDEGRDEADEIDALRAQATKLDTQLTEARKALAAGEEALSLAHDEAAAQAAELARLGRVEARCTELQTQLSALQAQDTVNVLAELQWENANLNAAVQELQAQLESAVQSNQQDQQLLHSLQAKSETLERELNETRALNPHSSPRPFESLADDEVLEEFPSPGGVASPRFTSPPASATATPAAAATTTRPPMHPFTPTKTPAVFDPATAHAAPTSPLHSNSKSGQSSTLATPLSAAEEAFAADQEVLSMARLAAESAPRAPHSSLASGSASLAYSSAAAFSPARRAMHVSTAGSPSLYGSATHAAGSHMRPSGAAGMLGFISSLLPGSGASAAAAAASPNHARGGASGIATAAATAAGNRAAFAPAVPALHPSTAGTPAQLVQYPASPAHVNSPGTKVWDEADLTRGGIVGSADRSSSHARTPPVRKSLGGSGSVPHSPLGERDADFEFFALTLLCVKIHCGRKMESLYTISTQDLWVKAKAEGVQFHQYYGWLEEELTKAYVAKLAAVRKDSAALTSVGGSGNGTEAPEEDGILESYLPSNSAVSSTPVTGRSRAASAAVPPAAQSKGVVAPTLNTAATRQQMQPSVGAASADALTLGAGRDAAGGAAAAAVRALDGGQSRLAASLSQVALTPSRSNSLADVADRPQPSP